jgi:DNA-binding GntR family transcriptional regulator
VAGAEGKTLQNYVRDYILSAISRGELVAGQHLKQREVAAQVGVSVTPVREALRELQAMGVVSFEPQKGAVVRELDYDEVIEMVRISDALAPLTAELLVERITDEEIEANESMCDLMEGTRDPAEYATLNRIFHSSLTRAAKAPRLDRILSQELTISQRLVCVSLQTISGRWTQANADHREFIASLRARDADRYLAVARRHRLPFREYLAGLDAGKGNAATDAGVEAVKIPAEPGKPKPSRERVTAVGARVGK